MKFRRVPPTLSSIVAPAHDLVPSTYFAALDLPLTSQDAIAPYRRVDHHPEIMALRRLMIVQFGGAVLADVLMRAISGNAQVASIMFALVFGHMAAIIAPRRVALRRKLAILRMKADQHGGNPYVPPDLLEDAVEDVRLRLNRLAGLELVALPGTAALLALTQLFVLLQALPPKFAALPHLSVPAVVIFTAFHEFRFRRYLDRLFPLPTRAVPGE